MNSLKLDVDGVLCISLKEREDRRKILSEEFSRLENDVEFVLVERDVENGERGCFDSHVLCAKIALERNYKNVLILEDDATLLPTPRKQVERINAFLRLRKPQIFYLGGMLGRMWAIPFLNVVRCRLTGTQAYILSRKGCQRLSKARYQGQAIDGFYCRNFKAYGTYPMISQQQPESVASSDIMDFRAQKKSKRVKDEAYWSQNYSSQKAALRRGWARTLFMRFL
ncbi:glycosyltransferase family 25 protein [Salinicola aestuarinus]|uniref:glycosyltransferase family 25 protein n=1 Tax=Salinicola aestuarinus TaxID=1949082 RepID=UPI000DA24ADC|nr:glycosyltransferase family 25 protein [Salinicola aestuarinus]